MRRSRAFSLLLLTSSLACQTASEAPAPSPDAGSDIDAGGAIDAGGDAGGAETVHEGGAPGFEPGRADGGGDGGLVTTPGDPCAQRAMFVGAVTIASQADLDAMRCYAEIHGSLAIVDSRLERVELPNLERVTGKVSIVYPRRKQPFEPVSPGCTASKTTFSTRPVALPALQHIEGNLSLAQTSEDLGGDQPVVDFGLPALTSVTGHVRLSAGPGALAGCGFSPREIGGNLELTLLAKEHGGALLHTTERVRGRVLVQGNGQVTGLLPALTQAGSLAISNNSGFVRGFASLQSVDEEIELTNVQGGGLTILRKAAGDPLPLVGRLLLDRSVGDPATLVAQTSELRWLRLKSSPIDTLMTSSSDGRRVPVVRLDPTAFFEVEDTPNLTLDEVCEYAHAVRQLGWRSTPLPNGRSCGIWQEPVTVAGEGEGQVGEPRLAVNQDGEALLVWPETRAGKTHVMGATSSVCGLQRGSRLDLEEGVPNPFPSPAEVVVEDFASGANTHSPAATIDELGQGTAVWLREEASGQSVWARRHRADAPSREEAWSAPMRVGAAQPPRPGRALAIASHPDAGVAVLAWERTLLEGRREVVASHFRDDAGWSDLAVVSAPAEDAGAPAVAVDARGGAALVWRSVATSGAGAFSSSFVNGAWAAPLRLEPPSTPLRVEPTILRGPDGTTQTVWSSHAGVWHRAGASGLPTPITTSSAERGAPVLASGAGKLAAAWREKIGESETVFVSVHAPGSGWSAPLAVSDAARAPADAPVIAIGPNGTILVAWSERSSLWVRRYAPEYERWTEPMQLSAAGAEARGPQVALSVFDRGVVAWQESEKAKTRIVTRCIW